MTRPSASTSSSRTYADLRATNLTRLAPDDGGAAVNDLLMQMQADLLGIPVIRPTCLESTALGAARFAAAAVGVTDFASSNAIDRVFEPSITADERTARLTDWNRAIDRARGWANG